MKKNYSIPAVEICKVNVAYGICEAGDYVFVATYNKADSCVKVLNKSDLSEVATLKYANQATDLSDIAFGGSTLFVGDHGDNSSTAGLYYKAAIDLSAGQQSQDTDTETQKADDPGTQTPDTTPEETQGDTNPPTPPTSDALIIGVAAVACIALAGAVIGKKIIK